MANDRTWPHSAFALPRRNEAARLVVVPRSSAVQALVYRHLSCKPDSGGCDGGHNKQQGDSEAKPGGHGEGLLLAVCCLNGFHSTPSDSSTCPHSF